METSLTTTNVLKSAKTVTGQQATEKTGFWKITELGLQNAYIFANIDK